MCTGDKVAGRAVISIQEAMRRGDQPNIHVKESGWVDTLVKTA